MALNSLSRADMPLSNYSLTHYGKIELNPIRTDERQRRTYGNGERYFYVCYGVLTEFLPMNVILTYFATETATATDTERWKSGINHCATEPHTYFSLRLQNDLYYVEMTYIMSGGALNSTHSLTYLLNVCVFCSPYVVGTMRHSASNSLDVQLAHHIFRWVLFSVHAEPVRGLLGRLLRRRRRAAEAEAAAARLGPGGRADVDGDGLGRVVNWLPKVWRHVNRFLEAHCLNDVAIGKRCGVKIR